MARQLSCGVLLRSGDKYLICHARQFAPPRPYDGKWTIPKGLAEYGERYFEAALRELKEETGIDLAEFCKKTYTKERGFAFDEAPHGLYMTSSKTVIVYFVEGPTMMENLTLECKSLIDNKEHPLFNQTEIDDFAWVTAEEGAERVFVSQRNVFGMFNQDGGYKTSDVWEARQ